MAGVKRAAPPLAGGAGPPAKRAASTKYDLKSMTDIPVSLRAKKVEKFVVEFIDLDRLYPEGATAEPDGIRTNHCIARLVFKHKQDSTTGLMINLDYIGTGVLRCGNGRLRIGTANYDGPHQAAAKTKEIPVRKGRGKNKDKTVKDFLQVLFRDDLIPCAFNTEQTNVAGCKDFLSQYVYRLNEARVLNISENIRTEVFDIFNHNYGPAVDEERDHGVGYACFNSTYHQKHHTITGINYLGNRFAQGSDEAKKPVAAEAGS